MHLAEIIKWGLASDQCVWIQKTQTPKDPNKTKVYSDVKLKADMKSNTKFQNPI